MNRYLKRLGSLFTNIWALLPKKSKKIFVLLFGMILGSSLIDTLSVAILMPLINGIVDKNEFVNYYIVKVIMQVLKDNDIIRLFIIYGSFVILFYLLKALYQLINIYCQQKFKASLKKYVSTTILRKYLSYPYSFYTDTSSSDFKRVILFDTENLEYVLESFFYVLTNGIMIIFFTCYLLYTDVFITIGFIITIGIVVLIPILFTSKKIKKLGGYDRDYYSKVEKNLTECFYGIKEIITNNRQKYFVDAYDKNYAKRNSFRIKCRFISASNSKIIEFCAMAFLIVMILFKFIYSGNDQHLIIQLGMFTIIALKLLPVVYNFQKNINNMIENSIMIGSLASIVNQGDEDVDSKSLPITFEKSISVNNVDFSYKNGNQKLFSKINLTINKGDVIGVKGSSGSGKTTLINLILGLFNTDNGTVKIDDVVLSEETKQSWYEKISYVSQQPYLLDDTITANVVFGNETIDNEKVKLCLEKAQLLDYIQQLPDGMNTVVGEQGVKLSGGQKQRIAIARALYKDAQVLFFDEATSALDEQTEAEIMNTINNLIDEKKTIILIAHRLSTLSKCNKIITVENGNVSINTIEK